MSEPRIDPILAGVRAVLDHHRERSTLPSPAESDRLDGRTCLVTGASSGLGRVLAVEMARRGAHVILACRKSHAGLAAAVARESGGQVSQRDLDLAELGSVTALADGLAADGARIDVLISNAGVAPAENRRTKDGLDELFQVNFLGSFLLVHRLLADGTLPSAAFGHPRDPGRPFARILITSSESHRLAPSIDFDRFGQFPDFNLLSGTTWYGHSKLYVQTFACELGRRLSPGGSADVSVFSYCPGAFRSNISREAGVLGKLMTSFFVDTETAAWPAVFAAVSPVLEGETPRYLYLRHFAEPDARARDRANGRRLWDLSLQILEGRGLSLRTLPP